MQENTSHQKKFKGCSSPSCIYAAGPDGECKEHCVHVDIRTIDGRNLVCKCDYCQKVKSDAVPSYDWQEGVPEPVKTTKAVRYG